MTKLVLVVGAGPVGMTMASELAGYGGMWLLRPDG